MVYASGEIVLADDYNVIIDLGTTLKINDIFGTGSADSGYGGLSASGADTETGVANLILSVTSGDIIQSFAPASPSTPDEWKNLRNAIQACAVHQGTVLPDTLPAESLVDDGDIVTAGINNFPNLSSVANVDLLVANRLNVGGGIIAPINVVTDTRVTPWSTLVRHDFTIDFGSADTARHFFNLSGDIRIGASRTGGSATPQNADWTALLLANAPYIFTRADYLAITGVFVDKLSVMGGGAYTNNLWIVKAKRTDAAPGSIFQFQSIFCDAHTGLSDVVDGTLASSIDIGSSLIFPLPGAAGLAGYTLIESLTAGS